MMYIWLIVTILLIIIELATVNLVSIWFIASSILALITSFFVENIVVQLAIFVIMGIIFLIITRPILKKWFNHEDIKTNFDRVIGMTGIVTETILNNEVGEVKVDGKRWSAISNENLEKDEIVKIIDIQGVKLKVKKCEE